MMVAVHIIRQSEMMIAAVTESMGAKQSTSLYDNLTDVDDESSQTTTTTTNISRLDLVQNDGAQKSANRYSYDLHSDNQLGDDPNFMTGMRYEGFIPYNASVPSTSHHNSTHITCFINTSEGWIQKMVPISNFWGRRSCKFYLGRDTAYFHQGKAGGGTVGVHATKYRLGLRSNHPVPDDFTVHDLMNGPLTSLIMSIRDPVDRFVSIFNWRLLTLCHPDDTRQKTVTVGDLERFIISENREQEIVRLKKKVGRHTDRPDRYCLSTRVEQEKILRETYRGDPNIMAEALCENSANYEQAVSDLSDINHSMMISQWLEFLIDPAMVRNITERGIQHFMAIPLTPQFEEYIEMLFSELLLNRYGNNVLQEMAQYMRGSNKRSFERKRERGAHSSVVHGYANSSALSKLAECCLTRHYEKDYRVIQSMLGDDEASVLQPIREAHPVLRTACEWGSMQQQELCRNNLLSMLKRRSAFFRGIKDLTCSELVK
jgi:hypothetical protein